MEISYATEVSHLSEMYRHIMTIMAAMTPRDRRKVEELEVIFVDIVNGKPVGRIAYSFKDVMDAINDGSKPVGILVGDFSPREAKRFPGLTEKEEEILMTMLAEAQDEEEDFHKSS